MVLSKKEDGTIQGAWPYILKKKFGFQILTQPILTQFLGPLLFYPVNKQKTVTRYSFENKVITDLERQLPQFTLFKQNFSPEISNWLPLYWKGYNQSTRYTYKLYEISNHEKLWSNLKPSVRNYIKKGENDLITEEENDIENLFKLNEKTFQRKGMKMPLTKGLLNRIYNVCQLNFGAKILTIKRGNIPIASMLLVFDAQCAYNLLLGIDKERNPRGAIQFLLWEAIKAASEKVDRFDFEGSMLREVETVFRAFGPQRIPYYSISKANRFIGSVHYLLKGRNLGV